MFVSAVMNLSYSSSSMKQEKLASTATKEHHEEQYINQDSPTMASLTTLDVAVQVCPQTDDAGMQINGFGRNKGKTLLKFIM